MKKQTPSSDADLLAEEAKYCSWGDTVHYANHPKVFESCDGSYLFDREGKPYLDLQMWYSAVNLGYRNKEVAAALKKQIETLPQLACQYLHRERIELVSAVAKKVKQSFGSDGRIHFNVGGSQSVEDAIKLVRQKTRKSLFFAYWGSYHGRTFGATEITSSYRYRRPFGHFSNRAQFVPYPYCFRCPYGKKFGDCQYTCVQQFEKLFETEYYSVWDPKAGESEFSAFFIEPIQGTGGYIIPPPDYYRKLKEILDRYKILLVDDEIQMGMYRTGKLFALEHFGVSPDIIVFGKALTNGMNPLSGVWAKEELIHPGVFPPGSTHSTFSSNPLGTAAGLRVMRLFEEEEIGARVAERGRVFLNMLERLKKKHRVIGDVSGIGLALRIEVCQKDGFTPNRELTDKIFQAGLEGGLLYKGKKYGLILDVGGYYKNIFTIAPSFYITDREIGMAYEFLDALFTQCQKE